MLAQAVGAKTIVHEQLVLEATHLLLNRHFRRWKRTEITCSIEMLDKRGKPLFPTYGVMLGVKLLKKRPLWLRPTLCQL